MSVTDTNRIKKAAEWFYTNVFTDEAIRPRAAQYTEKLPSQLRAARSLETGNSGWQSRETIFLKQAKLLASYEDEYTYDREVIRYFPTYQALTDQELRGYFSWRTKLRKNDLQKTSLTYAFVYTYELINQIGTVDAMDGYCKLREFRDAYGQLDKSILPYLDRWLTDYIVYYGLDPVLLSDSAQVLFDRNLAVLEKVPEHGDFQIAAAARALSPKWLERSKFYAENQLDTDTIIARVLRRVWEHYATRCKRSLVEQYFGFRTELQFRPFDSAVFCDRSKNRNREYVVDELCVYRCQGGLWSVRKYHGARKANGKLGDLLKAIDAVMREEYGYKHPIKCPLDTKWLLKLIREEVQSFLDERKAEEAKKITIDFSRLARIRQDAAITQDKLTVEEELDFAEETPQTAVTETTPLPAEPDGSCPLSPAEYRLIQSLLYGSSTSWVSSEGHILSVLVDGINEKLYDIFMDSVLDDTPELIDDYIDELKEMVKP